MRAGSAGTAFLRARAASSHAGQSPYHRSIDWHFHSPSGLSNASFDERADPEPFDEAYPHLDEPVAAFVARYLASRETVLILQGPPGTGKTHLLMARASGNVDLHRFLAIADGWCGLPCRRKCAPFPWRRSTN